MNIQFYLGEIKPAVEPILNSIWSEHKKLNELQQLRAAATAKMEDGYSRVEFLAMNPDLDDEGLATFNYWDTYFGADKDQHNLGIEVRRQEATIDILNFSRAALSGTILQFSKQGLSICHGNRANVPDGKEIAGQLLKNIVWEGRNHALHWEEGNPRQAVIDCLEGLANTHPDIAHFRTKNCSFEILQILEWTDWHSFETDLLSLS